MYKEIRSYKLSNLNGMEVTVSNLGATIMAIRVPDRRGFLSNVVLAYPDLASYWTDPYYIGATLGRYANRIKKGGLPIDGQQYSLSVNETDKRNHLHGGYAGFNKKTWEVARYNGKELELHYLSPSGEEGYPGTLSVKAVFSLTDRDEFWIAYEAHTDAPTVVNLSNHSYFNLLGKGDVGQHVLQVHAGRYTPTDKQYIPNGEIAAVQDTCFDLRKETHVRDVMEEIITANYAFGQEQEITLMATLKEEQSGRQMEISGTQPGLQVYFGNYLAMPFFPFQGICLEPQHYPDSPNHSHFPSSLLRPGELYQQQIGYRFTNF